MVLTNTSDAIGAVTAIIRQKLEDAIKQAPISIAFDKVILGFPRNSIEKNIYLSLYEVIFDASLKNVSLDEGQPPPIWLVLKYLLTAYDDGDTTTYDAYKYLGKAVRASQDLNFLDFSFSDPWIVNALKDNPEPLKLTFNEIPADLIATILGDVSAKYQCSISFQVRPIMIARGAESSYSHLIGVDYTKDEIIGEEGIKLSVELLNFPFIEEVSPERMEFENEADKEVSIKGSGLNQPNLNVRLASADFKRIRSSNDSTGLKWTINENEIVSHYISAGSHPLSIVQKIKDAETGLERIRYISNVKIFPLLPYLKEATVNSDEIKLTGTLLGRRQDAIVVAFYKEGQISKAYDVFSEDDYSEDQTTLTIKCSALSLDTGSYRIILRVNNQYARQSPAVSI